MMMDTAEGNESPNRSTEGKTSARRQKEGKKKQTNKSISETLALS